MVACVVHLALLAVSVALATWLAPYTWTAVPIQMPAAAYNGWCFHLRWPIVRNYLENGWLDD